MERIGTISFQANNQKDVFFVADVPDDLPEYLEKSDERLIDVEAADFESSFPWANGKLPKIYPVHIEGDVVIIYGWFKGESFRDASTITICVEYEEVESLEAVEADEKSSEENSLLDPVEVNL